MKNIEKLARSDGANAFIAEPGTANGPRPDDLAEYLGESFVASATGAEDPDQIVEDDIDVEKLPGPSDQTDASATFDGDLETAVASRPSQPHTDNPSGKAKKPRDRGLEIVASPLSGSKARRARR
jgi:hypothetical protein